MLRSILLGHLRDANRNKQVSQVIRQEAASPRGGVCSAACAGQADAFERTLIYRIVSYLYLPNTVEIGPISDVIIKPLFTH